MTTAIDSTTPTTTPTDSKSNEARNKLSGDFDTFLQLLVTQLKNQDPLEPLDTHQFTSQLVQFASVEQAIATNENLEKMLEADRNAAISSAAGYVGKFIQAEGKSARLKDGVASFTYELTKPAYQVEVVITDDLGQIVYKGAAPTEKGKNDVLWDGTSNIDGQEKPDGTYHISVVAKDAKMEPVEVKTFTTGFVSAVDIEDGEMNLKIGEISVALDKVLLVRDPTDFAS